MITKNDIWHQLDQQNFRIQKSDNNVLLKMVINDHSQGLGEEMDSTCLMGTEFLLGIVKKFWR